MKNPMEMSLSEILALTFSDENNIAAYHARVNVFNLRDYATLRQKQLHEYQVQKEVKKIQAPKEVQKREAKSLANYLDEYLDELLLDKCEILW